MLLYYSNDIEEHLEETAAEAEPEPEAEPEQEPEPEVQEEKSEPVLEESAPEETVEKSPSPAPADPAPAVQEDSRVMTVDLSSLMWFHQYGSPVSYVQGFIFICGFLSLLSVKGGKSGQIGTQEPNTLVNLDVILDVGPLLCLVSTVEFGKRVKCDSIVITLLNLNNLKEIVGKLLLAGS